MSSLRLEIAHELIELNAPLDPSLQFLFGHNKPFGSRWKIDSGQHNLIPFRTTTRVVDMNNGFQTVSPESRFKDLYFQGRKIGTSIGLTNPDFLAIYDGIPELRIRVGMPYSYAGIITIEQALAPDAPAGHTSADLGRMMLVDELLLDQGIRSSSRQVMTPEHAITTSIAVLNVVNSALPNY